MHLKFKHYVRIAWLIIGIAAVFMLHFLAGFSYLAAVGITIFGLLCILANGLLATWEDERPGGFNNPLPQKSKKGSEHE
jgi:hypothetical protein